MKHWTSPLFALLALAVLALAPVGAALAQVKVTAADPASTYQGTASLDVAISGSGFDSTAKARFLVSGSTSDTGGITVTKVVVQGSKKLIATISVAESALVSKFDIEVTLNSGRKGKGTTLFSVQAKTSDPCTQPGLDFPAFVYWRQNGASTRQLLVADATGTCSRSIMNFVAANGTAFSYPVAGTENVGRIVFSDNGNINWRDFTVNHDDNSIVLGNTIPLLPSLDVAGHELSPDGTTVYFSVGAGSPEGYARIYKSVIGDPQPPQEVYRSLIPGAGFNNLSVSTDGTTLVVEQLSPFPVTYRVLRLTLPCSDAIACATVLAETATVAAPFWPALNSIEPTVGYAEYLPGFNQCSQVRFLDLATGAPVYAGTQPRYGTALSWLDNKLLVNGHKPPDRRATCQQTGFVTLIDPATGAETPLVSGYGPDGR